MDETTIEGTYLTSAGLPEVGRVGYFRLTTYRNPTTGVVVPSSRYSATLDVSGSFSLSVLPGDYYAVVALNGKTAITRRVRIPESATPVNVASLPDLLPSTVFSSYVPLGSDGKIAAVYLPATSSGGGVVPFEHVQTVPAATWIITHNQGREPLVVVIVDGAEVGADVVYGSTNAVTVVFSQPTIGRVSLI